MIASKSPRKPVRRKIGLLSILVLTAIFLSTASAAPRDLMPVQMHAADAHGPVVVVDHGRGLATLCVFGPRSAQLNEMVGHLQAFIEKSTGAKLPIVYDKLLAPSIVIGDCEAAREHGLTAATMPPDGFAIKTSAQHVFIAGRDGKLPDDGISNGTAYGVIEFLERFVGVRWYFPTELGQSIPATPTLAVDTVWLSDAPVFRKRVMWPPTSDSWHGTGTPLAPVQNFLRAGDSWPHQLVVHSPDWSHVKEYTEKRPEIFQLRSDGTRDFSMLCYGNPHTLATYLENIERHARGEKGVHLGISGHTIAVSPADAEIACNCEDCKKLWNKNGGQYGSASPILAKFVADLGREVAKRFPQYDILYLPYLNYTDAVPGTTFPGNVEVQLCGMPGLAQYKEPGIAASEQMTIDGWIKASGHKIQNWHYSCWPEDRTPAVYLFPHTIRDFYRQNRDKTVGTFINGTADHWPRQHLSLYCWLKVLWNPNFDVDAAMDEYCRRMYGRASATMRELVQLQIDGWEKSRWPGGRLSPKALYDISFPPATVARMEQLLAQAREQLAGHELELKRLDYYAGPFQEFFKQSKDYHCGTGLRPLVAQKVGENPTLDGKLDDAVWQRATPIEFVRGWDRKQSQCTYPTTVRAVWTADGITFGFRMTEPTPELLERGIKGRDDSMAWWDDNVELLFDPTGRNEGDYYQFIINANNAVADAHGRDFSANFPEVKSAVFVGKDFWSMEVFVPYTVFPGTAKPGSGTNTVWYGNFTRHRVADQGLKPKMGRQKNSLREYQRMNTTYAAPSNNLSDFAPIQFRE
jgi:hypothetical protein